MKKQSVVLGLFLLGTTSLSWAMDAQEFKDAGMALYRAGQYAKALDYFKNAVQANPNDAEAYEDLGNAYAKVNDNADARDAYQKSLQINPNNSTVQVLLDNLNGNSPAAQPPQAPENTAPAPSNPNQVESDQPLQPNQPPGYFPRPRRFVRRAVTPPVDYKDGLAPMDHSKFWVKLELGYDYALQTDLVNSASSFNNGTFNPANAITGSATYSGSALASNSGLGWGGELGFLVSPHFGIGLGARYVQTNDYTANVQYDTGDQENLTLSPSVIPITLDLYLFLPDHDGRFFISGGVGYHQGIVHVDQTTTTNNFFSTPTGPAEWAGNLYAGNVGFQVGIGREFAVSRRFGIELYARGFYAQITNFTGTLYDGNGNSQAFGLATSSTGPAIVDADYPQYINGTERYTTIDFTGFDLGCSLNFYSF